MLRTLTHLIEADTGRTLVLVRDEAHNDFQSASRRAISDSLLYDISQFEFM